MNKLRMIFFAVLGVMFMALPTLAQTAAVAADNESSVNKYAKLAAGLGFGLAAGLAALGQGKIAASAAEGAARNPAASGKIQTMMIIGLAFVETLVIFTLLIMFTRV